MYMCKDVHVYFKISQNIFFKKDKIDLYEYWFWRNLASNNSVQFRYSLSKSTCLSRILLKIITANSQSKPIATLNNCNLHSQYQMQIVEKCKDDATYLEA